MKQLIIYIILLASFLGQKPIYKKKLNTDYSLYRTEKKVLIGHHFDRFQLDSVLNQEKDIWYIEKNFTLSKQEWMRNDLYLNANLYFSSSKIFINDSLIISEGVIGNSDEIEIKGHYRIYRYIPSTLLNVGENTLRVKFSNHIDVSDRFRTILFLLFGYEAHPNKHIIFASMFFGGFFILAFIFNLSVYFAYGKKKEHLFLSLFFLFYIFMMVKEYCYYELNPHALHIRIYIYVFYFSDLFAKIMLFFALSYEFYQTKKVKSYEFIMLILAVIFHTIGVIFYFNELYNNGLISLLFYFTLLPVLSLSIRSNLENKRGSTLSLIAVLLMLFFTFQNYQLEVQLAYFRGVFVYGLIMVVMFSRNLMIKNKELNESKLKSERLENQLLQKHIQPHFIMNSLMSLQEFVDTNSKNASKLIEALSEEFHLLSEIRKEKLVELSRELEICRIHLKIFGYQKCSNFTLETEGISGNELIPPAVFHTLIENGLTHGYQGIRDGYFKLNKIDTRNGVRYTLFNDSKPGLNKKKGSGTGLMYVRARLDESFKGRWDLISHKVDGGWEVILEIRD